MSGDSFNACLLFFSNRLQPQGRVYPQASPAVGIYSSSGLPANKTHVDLPRNGEGLGSREQPASVSQKKNKKKPTTHKRVRAVCQRPLCVSARTLAPKKVCGQLRMLTAKICASLMSNFVFFWSVVTAKHTGSLPDIIS